MGAAALMAFTVGLSVTSNIQEEGMTPGKQTAAEPIHSKHSFTPESDEITTVERKNRVWVASAYEDAGMKPEYIHNESYPSLVLEEKQVWITKSDDTAQSLFLTREKEVQQLSEENSETVVRAFSENVQIAQQSASVVKTESAVMTASAESEDRVQTASEESENGVQTASDTDQEISEEEHPSAEQTISEETAEETVPVSEPAAANRWGITLTADEVDLLARIVWLESQGEPVEGQQAVVEVVFNRMASEVYPDTLYEVLSQSNPVQFCSWKNRGIAQPTQKEYDSIYGVLNGATGILGSETMYFSTFPLTQYIETKIGGHYFCYK